MHEARHHRPGDFAEPTQVPSRWPRTVVLVHWTTAALVALGVSLVYCRAGVDGRSLRDVLLSAHQWGGVLVWAACWLRLAARFSDGSQSPHTRASSGIATWAASATHATLYVLLLAVPLLGWALSDARGHPMGAIWPGSPVLVNPNPDLADELESAHRAAAWTLLGLALFHALAAAWHHFVLRDGVLASMSLAPARPETKSLQPNPPES